MLGLDIGTVAGWITALSSLGIFASLGTLTVAWWRRGVSLKGLSDTAEGKLRDHYAEELERVVKRQHDCEEREEALRKRVRDVENLLEGVYRMLVQNSAEKVLEMGDTVPPHVRDLAKRSLAAQRRSVDEL
jgi:hypothetical protein